MTGMVPEPEHKEENEHIGDPLQVEIGQQADVHSSDDETGDEDDATGVVNGYIPLSQFQNSDGPDDEANDSFGSDEEVEETNEPSKESEREIHVDQDLVMHAMKGISLSGNCIPAWAKELSDSEWSDIVKQTINGEKVSAQPSS